MAMAAGLVESQAVDDYAAALARLDDSLVPEGDTSIATPFAPPKRPKSDGLDTIPESPDETGPWEPGRAEEIRTPLRPPMCTQGASSPSPKSP